MAIYIILAITGFALYKIIRGEAKAEVKQDIAEAKVAEITKTISESNDIEKTNAALSDAELDNKLYPNSTNK